MTGIIDYDAGNIRSVENALHLLGEQTIVSREKDALFNADRLILPGVGSFGEAMEKIHSYGLAPVIAEAVERKMPFLGICLGLQLLFEKSEEAPHVKGLGLLKGEILKIPGGKGLKIPHMGWNTLDLHNEGRLFKGFSGTPYVYFVHSYYLKAAEESIVTASTLYGMHIHASVEQDNVFACQFHPEKSGEAGLKILKNFICL